MAQACSGAGGCPRVFVSTDGEVIVQGYRRHPTGIAEPPTGEAQAGMDLATWRRLAEEVEAAQGDPFSSFQSSAWRLEALPQYLVDVEADRFRAFRAGREMPPWPAASEEWFRSIAAGTAAGKRWSRVHVVDFPLSDYTRFEMECYRDNVAAGEDVRIVDRAVSAGLAELREDFWLFDDETDRPYALLMRYDRDGRWLGYWRTQDAAAIRECRRQRLAAEAVAVPLAEFVASMAAR